jgi:hypothetical protein
MPHADDAYSHLIAATSLLRDAVLITPVSSEAWLENALQTLAHPRPDPEAAETLVVQQAVALWLDTPAERLDAAAAAWLTQAMAVPSIRAAAHRAAAARRASDTIASATRELLASLQNAVQALATAQRLARRLRIAERDIGLGGGSDRLGHRIALALNVTADAIETAAKPPSPAI